MPRKKKEKSQEKETPRLTEGQYWEYRCTVNDIDLAKKDREIANLTHRIKEMESAMARQKTIEAAATVRSREAEYTRFIKELEDKLKTEIKGKIIDPLDFSLKGDECLNSFPSGKE